MKALILSLSVFAAQAETIPLNPVACGSLPSCQNVSADPDVDLNAGQFGLAVIINGVAFSPSVPTDQLDFSAGIWVYDAAMNQALFTGTFTHTAVKVRSGGRYYYKQVWGFSGGTLVLP